MPDELDALRHFRDETPGPSTGAWNRARAAIASARAEEEPAVHPPGRQPGRRRVLLIATGCAVAAAVAGLLATLLPGSPATQGASTRIEATAFVTRVEHALAQSDQRKLIGYARTVYPPGYAAEPVAPRGLKVSAGRGFGSPWSVGSLVRWSYRDTDEVSALTAAGHRVFALRIAPVRGILAVTGVIYRSGTWWHATIGPVSAGNGPPAPLCGSLVQLGTGGWPVFLRHELSCGEFTKGGLQRIGGAEAVKLTSAGGAETFWVNPKTYLPVRAVFIVIGERVQTDFGWFPPTRARLAQLHLSVPPGFRQVSPPDNPPPLR